MLLLVCSVKKAAPSCPLFDWVRSMAPFDLSPGWLVSSLLPFHPLSNRSSSVSSLWNLLSVSLDDVHNLASWMCLLVSENSHGTVASQIAQSLSVY